MNKPITTNPGIDPVKADRAQSLRVGVIVTALQAAIAALELTAKHHDVLDAPDRERLRNTTNMLGAIERRVWSKAP